jgi:exodeoxyribonuclease V gamma subunit
LPVQHPLQPFAPAAFGGDGEPRRFSYRGQWHPAAGRVAARRAPLPPWFSGEAMPPEDDASPVPIDALRRFLLAPAEQFLRQRLGLRLDGIEDAGEDIEPLRMPDRGLARSEVQAAVFEALLRGDDEAATHASLRARGLLPSGPLGRRTLAVLHDEVMPYARAFADWRGDSVPERLRVEIVLDGLALHGTLDGLYPHGIARVRLGAPGGNAAIRDGLDWLLASAAGVGMPLVQFHDAGDAGVGPHARAPLEAGQARQVLRRLLALRRDGLREPLPFAPYSGWELFRAAPDLEKGLKAAAAKWYGSERSWAEGEGEALRLALRGRDPFADPAMRLRFVDLAMAIYLAVTEGVLHAGTDADALQALAGAFEAEDGA